MNRKRIVSLGEVLWDLLPSGAVLGGAPANFAIHAHALGGDSKLVSCVGKDALGNEILKRFKDRGMSIELIGVDDERPTGSVLVTLASDGQPNYVIQENTAWDCIVSTTADQHAALSADAICFGSLAQRSPTSRTTIQSLAARAPATALRMFDINLRQAFYSREVIEASLRLANTLKLNETELPVLAEMFSLSGDLRMQISELVRAFNLRGVAFTRGGAGSVLLVDGIWSEHAGTAVEVADTVGAGDSFTAGFILGLLAEVPLATIHQRASDVSAFVCSQAGPTPLLPDRFKSF